MGNLFLINDNLKMQDLSLADVKNKNHINRTMIDFYLQSNEYDNAIRYKKVKDKIDFIKKYKINFIIKKSNVLIDSSIENHFLNKKRYNEYIIYY